MLLFSCETTKKDCTLKSQILLSSNQKKGNLSGVRMAIFVIKERILILVKKFPQNTLIYVTPGTISCVGNDLAIYINCLFSSRSYLLKSDQQIFALTYVNKMKQNFLRCYMTCLPENFLD